MKLRAVPLEKMWARILREAGARVREHFFLRNAGIESISPQDGRHIEIVATGLPLHRGVPLAVDATLVSPLHADGSPQPGAASEAGASLRRAEHSKQTTYPELVDSARLRLVTAAMEAGGRSNEAAQQLLSAAAVVRARDVSR